ncbi:MAG: nuclear transport factor 2 family protein [Boseongicola sp.]
MKSAEELTTRIEEHARNWSARDADAVAAFYAEDTVSAINGGEVMKGRPALREMAAGFMHDFPDLTIRCEAAHVAGRAGLFMWTLEGTHKDTGNFVHLPGWEELEFTEDGLIAVSRGRFDAEDYDRQVAGR